MINLKYLAVHNNTISTLSHFVTFAVITYLERKITAAVQQSSPPIQHEFCGSQYTRQIVNSHWYIEFGQTIWHKVHLKYYGYHSFCMQLPGIVYLVCRYFFCCNMRSCTWSLKVPMVETMQEHLGQIIHRVPFLKKNIRTCPAVANYFIFHTSLVTMDNLFLTLWARCPNL